MTDQDREKLARELLAVALFPGRSPNNLRNALGRLKRIDHVSKEVALRAITALSLNREGASDEFDAGMEEAAQIAENSLWSISDERIAPRLRTANRHRNQNAKWIAEGIRARKRQPLGDNITVFTIRVGEENSKLHIRAGKAVQPREAIDAAIKALVAERGDLENCPVHADASSLNRVSIADETPLRAALEKCRDRFLEYEKMHRAKLLPNRTPDVFFQAARTSHNEEVRAKMARNREMAEMCIAALSSTPTPTGEYVYFDSVAGQLKRVPIDGEDGR